MSSTDQLDFQNNINHANTNQLKLIIQKLIYKSKLLIQNLENTVKQLESANAQKVFWKKTYFAFKQTCQKYIQSKGIAPFQYLVNLQAELKTVQIQKNTMMQKLNGYTIQKIGTYQRKNQSKSKALSLTQRKQQIGDFSSLNRISPNNSSKHKHYYSKRKHQIGPKRIQLFRSKDSKQQTIKN